jgi:hypothetical protein
MEKEINTQKPTNGWDVLNNIINKLSNFIEALLVFIVALVCTPVGWVGLLILAMIFGFIK